MLTDGNDSPQGSGLWGSLPGNPLEGGYFSENRGQGSQDRQPQGNQGQNGSDQGDRQHQENQEQAGAAAAEDLQVTLELVNSWESEGKHFYQYEMKVENISDKAIDGWSADIVFNQTPEVSDSWNGTYTLEGNTLHVSSVDYNGRLRSGESTGNIGFILSGGADLSPDESSH